MATPSFQAYTTGTAIPGQPVAEDMEARILTALATIASGQNPDGTTSPSAQATINVGAFGAVGNATTLTNPTFTAGSTTITDASFANGFSGTMVLNLFFAGPVPSFRLTTTSITSATTSIVTNASSSPLNYVCLNNDIIAIADGSGNTAYFTINHAAGYNVQGSTGSSFTMTVAALTTGGYAFPAGFNSLSTTIGATANGGSLRHIGDATWTSTTAGSLAIGVLPVASTAGAPTTGTLYVADSGGTATITYAGVSGNTFTGCVYVSGATGTVTTGGAVSPAYTAQNLARWPSTLSTTITYAGGTSATMATAPSQSSPVGLPDGETLYGVWGTDDTTAIQTAVSTLIASGSSAMLVFPKTGYLCTGVGTGVSTVPLRLQGNERAGTTLYASTSGNQVLQFQTEGWIDSITTHACYLANSGTGAGGAYINSGGTYTASSNSAASVAASMTAASNLVTMAGNYTVTNSATFGNAITVGGPMTVGGAGPKPYVNAAAFPLTGTVIGIAQGAPTNPTYDGTTNTTCYLGWQTQILQLQATSAGGSTTTVTVTIDNTSLITVGSSLYITGAEGVTNVNGAITVVTVTSPTTFTYTAASAPVGQLVAGTATLWGPLNATATVSGKGVNWGTAAHNISQTFTNFRTLGTSEISQSWNFNLQDHSGNCGSRSASYGADTTTQQPSAGVSFMPYNFYLRNVIVGPNLSNNQEAVQFVGAHFVIGDLHMIGNAGRTAQFYGTDYVDLDLLVDVPNSANGGYDLTSFSATQSGGLGDYLVNLTVNDPHQKSGRILVTNMRGRWNLPFTGTPFVSLDAGSLPDAVFDVTGQLGSGISQVDDSGNGMALLKFSGRMGIVSLASGAGTNGSFLGNIQSGTTGRMDFTGVEWVSPTCVVASGSNGGEISTIATWGATFGGNGVLKVGSTISPNFPTSGTIQVAASGSTTAVVTYTGTTATSFTGCAYVSGSAIGTVATNGLVTFVPPYWFRGSSATFQTNVLGGSINVVPTAVTNGTFAGTIANVAGYNPVGNLALTSPSSGTSQVYGPFAYPVDITVKANAAGVTTAYTGEAGSGNAVTIPASGFFSFHVNPGDTWTVGYTNPDYPTVIGIGQ